MGAKRLTSDESEFLEGADDILEGQFEDVSGLQDDLDGQLHAIFADVGGEPDDTHYEIRVYRPQKGKGALGYLFACLPAELPIMDKLRDDYGGGSFEVRVLKDKRIFRRKTVIVEPPLKSAEKPMADAAAGMAEVMAQGFTRLGELIVTQNAQQVAQVQGNGGMREMLETMVAMKTFMGEPAPSVSPLNMLKDVLEIIPAMGGGGGDKSETNVNDVLLSLAETVLPRLAEAGAAQPSPAGQFEQPNAGGVAAELPGGASDAGTMRPMPEERLQNPIPETNKPVGARNPMKMHLIFLCTQAMMKRDPATYASMVLDNTADDKLDELIDFVTGDDALEKMGRTHDVVLKYPEWFKQLGVEILALVTDTEEPEVPETIPGNGGPISGELLTDNEKPAINSVNVPDIEPTTDPNDSDTVGNSERESGH